MTFDRITVDPDLMGGVPTIRGLRISVATPVGVRLLLDNNLSPRLVDVLPQVEEDLRLGSIVVIDDDSLRIRRLPIG
jgi:hypothetical protein